MQSDEIETAAAFLLVSIRSRRRCIRVITLLIAWGCSFWVAECRAELTIVNDFQPGIGTLVGLGFDADSQTLWLYGDFDADFRQYSTTGEFMHSVPRPGEGANDFDLDFATRTLSIAGTTIPSGALIAINGESSVADLYAVDTSDGTVLATLETSFGNSHVVGGAYHAMRNTFFLVQDRVPGGTNASVIAEVDPANGSVLNSFQITAVLGSFTVNFGDLDVGANGNLFVVSSDETTIAEFSPGGAFIQEIALPTGVASLSGIDFDPTTGDAWVAGVAGTVWRLGGLTCAGADLAGDYNCSGLVEQGDLDLVLLHWGTSVSNPVGIGWTNDLPVGTVDQGELDKVLLNWGTGTPTGVPLPEPSTFMLVLATGAIILTANRWRSRACIDMTNA